MKLFVWAIISVAIVGTMAWDNEELEIFDLVEEINQNFYEFMDIKQDATNNEIKRAFRNLSIILHPDKNPSEDANIQFRNLVSIYEVLKDASKREKYDKVLKDGLPNWKSALYYYRRMRKIGIYEGSLIVFVIITIGQYLYAWAAYFEKKYTAEQVIGSKLKKMQKKNRIIDMETILNEIPTPSLLNTLPFQIPMAIWNAPRRIKETFARAHDVKEALLEERRLKLEEEQRQAELEKEQEELLRLRKEKKENIRQRKQTSKAPEKTDADLQGYSQIQTREFNEDDAIRPASHKTTITGGFWTDEDLAELIRLVKKYPSGSASRWNTIAEAMNRTVAEVTFMAAKMKENGYRIPGQTDSVAETIVQQAQVVKKERVKKKTEKNILLPESSWSQDQQRALEAAIVQYRKTAAGDRWQKIANCVPDKTKEECLMRYKYLCELVKSQKKAEETEQQESVETASPEEHGQDHMEKLDIMSAENIADDVSTEEITSKIGDGNKKRSKREERRRRKNFSSDEEDSDDAYQYDIS